MEITIKIKNESEHKRIKRILKGEKINILVNGKLRKSIVLNKETLDTFRKTDNGEDLIYCKDTDEFYKKLKFN